MVVERNLIHWPVKGLYKDTWRALEKLYAEGHVRAIGVSNFQIHHLRDLLANANVVPAVNQVEYHPRLSKVPLRQFCEHSRYSHGGMESADGRAHPGRAGDRGIGRRL